MLCSFQANHHMKCQIKTLNKLSYFAVLKKAIKNIIYLIETNIYLFELCRLQNVYTVINYFIQLQNYLTKANMNREKPQTLRDYLDSYQSLRRCKSNEYLLGVSSAVSNYKPTSELEGLINQKLNYLKAAFTSKNQKVTQHSITETLHVLTKAIKQILSKLKRLQGIQGNIKQTNCMSSNLISSNISNKQKKSPSSSKKSSFRQKQLKKIQSTQLGDNKRLENLEIKKNISDNFSISCLSNTTEPPQFPQALSPIIKLKQKNINAEEYFNKRIKQAVSLNPQKTQKQMSTGYEILQDEGYIIKISSCNQITGQ